MSEIEEIRKKWQGEISEFPYSKGAKRDIQVLLSEVTRLNKLLTLETDRAMKAEAQHFKAMQEIEELRAEINSANAIRQIRDDQLQELKAEVTRLQERVKELEEMEGSFKTEIAKLRNDLLFVNKRVDG